MAGKVDVKAKAEEAIDAAEKFYKLFYEKYDKKRKDLVKIFYLDSSALLWDGHKVEGSAEIQKFLDNLPSSVTKVDSLDAQPMFADANVTSIMVSVSGTIEYGDQPKRLFMQNFVLVAVNNTWKIASDTLRTSNSPS